MRLSLALSALLSLFLLAPGAAQAQEVCVFERDLTYCTDGTLYLYPDGRYYDDKTPPPAAIQGQTVFRSDGYSWSSYGNTIYGSDGTTWTLPSDQVTKGYRQPCEGAYCN